ncbi:Lipin/Ned1/Smp2-domain-containing protein [Infundibulicybe gibba]|nr:Lipin/Ned1/Smp2-domain-containing protein [Infundibulicybe gibba]
MNYIRGAVSAISAPYQYYKDLPPINPSTLTGAIDVIVVQRPTESGDTELVCSPFHVRFGKWQVLRPGEKKVNVSVNGHPIPFHMKIGEAGEAFFVFETDDDVPEDLITSPILQPTRPMRLRRGTMGDGDDLNNQEPEFLDLNALPSSSQAEDEKDITANDTPEPIHAPISKEITPAEPPRISHALPSPPPSPTPHNPQERQIDEAVRDISRHLRAPDVEYHHDIVLDAEGYHAHGRERSDRTIRPSESHKTFSTVPRSSTPSPTDIRHTQSHIQTTKEQTNIGADARVDLYPFPVVRATSEPPPDIEDDPVTVSSPPATGPAKLSIVPPVQEYSWEWGAFPQPSPMKTTFGKGGRLDSGLISSREAGTWGTSKGKGKTGLSTSRLGAKDESDDEEEHGRSRSVPPGVEGSPTRKRTRVDVRCEEMGTEETKVPDDVTFGAGGVLKASKFDPARFKLSIEGKKTEFELSVVSVDEVDENYERGRGRRTRDGSLGGVEVFDGRDEVEAARLFEKCRITFEQFMSDEDIVRDPRLVIRWAGERYITRGDGSPLMDALVVWRDLATRRMTEERGKIRPSSPLSDEEPPSAQPDERQTHNRSKSEPPEKMLTNNNSSGKPTSLSWVQWWSRSRRNNSDAAKTKSDRPGLRGTASAPLTGNSTPREIASAERRVMKEILPAESAPALPSTPIQKPVDLHHTPPRDALSAKRRFAKTLRLTSDQLKSLNLKPGANSITFSLSAIFVWDSTDLVVVSDIDGTITKSDGLGHVFAMIGRDWTHLGVAKLYTDITRNGYKIIGIKQNDYQLPEGPVVMSPDRLMASLHREVIMRKPEVFKMACLRDIQRLFGEASRNPFYAGFGNRITDALSYRSVNVPSARIFTIDSSGEVKMELLELAGYKSSYIHMTDLVDQMFPPIHQKWAPEFTDFNFWKPPSTLARLRNFSLVSNRQASSTRTSPMAIPRRGTSPGENLPQMSSFEKISSTLAGFAQSSSPSNRRSISPDSSSSYAGSDDEADEDELDADGKRRRRQRRRSMTSMPGSLDDMHFGMDDDDDDRYDEAEEGTYEQDENAQLDDEDVEATIDEDLWAAGEMKDVPFL